MTVDEFLANNSMLDGFTQWYSKLKVNCVSTEPGLFVIPPGYRSIAKWIRSRMI
jgi:hypothetical protein